MPPTPQNFLSFKRTFLQGFVSGIGWAFGATIGFAILLTLLGYVFSILGYIPLINRISDPLQQIVEQVDDPRDQIFKE